MHQGDACRVNSRVPALPVLTLAAAVSLSLLHPSNVSGFCWDGMPWGVRGAGSAGFPMHMLTQRQ
jgi:hypothetical protein